MPTIRSLRANVSRDEAMAQFSARGPRAVFRQLALGPLRSVAEFYIPFRLFQVNARNGAKQEQYVLGIDAVTGTLDLYGFDAIPGASQLVCLETRNCPEPRLAPAQQRDQVVEKFQRAFFRRGFFRINGLTIVAEPVPGELHIPYWVGFFGAGSQARIEVLDAVRRRVEGAKVRHLLQTWLNHESQMFEACPDATVLR
jgi:hypothetical protein